MRHINYIALCSDLSWLPFLASYKEQARTTFILTPMGLLSPHINKKFQEIFARLEEIDFTREGTVWVKCVRERLEQIFPHFQHWDQEKPFLKNVIAVEEIDLLKAGLLRSALKVQDLNQGGQSYDSAVSFRDKIHMKQILSDQGFSVPAFQRLQKTQDIFDFGKKFGYPIVLKPVMSTGSEGLFIFENQETLNRWMHQQGSSQPESLFGQVACSSGDFQVSYQVEKFIQGRMYHVNGLVIDGRIRCSWPSLYFQSSARMLQEKCASSYLLSSENPLVPVLNAYAEHVLQALPTPRHTAFHLEFFMEEGTQDIFFCEVASRVGGKGVNDSWKRAFHIDLKAIFVGLQYGLRDGANGHEFPFPEPQQPIRPLTLVGEIWFPVRPGRVVAAPSCCPFPWVTGYHLAVRVGDALSTAENIQNITGGASCLEASSEAEMEEKILAFEEWFERELKISES